MIRTTTWVASIAIAAAIAAWLVAPAGAVATPNWSSSRCALQQSLFNARHPHPNGQTLAGGNRILKQHGCAQRVPGPEHWSGPQCQDYQAIFLKLHAFPSGSQLSTANKALKHHGCPQRVKPLPAQQ